MKVLCRYAYQGSLFEGFSREEGRVTVEETVARGLVAVGALREGDFPAHASRTDRGVSALGNCFAFASVHGAGRAAETLGALNSRLVDAGVFCTSHALVGNDFRPRDALSRTYAYLLTGRDLRGDPRESLARLDVVLRAFTGTHDFTNFSKNDPSRETVPVRTVDVCTAAGPERAPELLGSAASAFLPPGGSFTGIIVVSSRGFLWNQVRRMVGSALDCVEGRLDPGDIQAALLPEEDGGKPLPRQSVAPAERLVLWDVDYGKDVEFRPLHGDESHPARWLRDMEERVAGLDLRRALILAGLDRAAGRQ